MEPQNYTFWVMTRRNSNWSYLLASISFMSFIAWFSLVIMIIMGGRLSEGMEVSMPYTFCLAVIFWVAYFLFRRKKRQRCVIGGKGDSLFIEISDPSHFAPMRIEHPLGYKAAYCERDMGKGVKSRELYLIIGKVDGSSTVGFQGDQNIHDTPPEGFTYFNFQPGAMIAHVWYKTRHPQRLLTEILSRMRLGEKPSQP